MIGEIGNFKMKKLLLILLCLPLLGWGQDLKGKDDLTFEEYKKQEQQKYSDFEKKMILELNNYIVLEEEWNIITVSQKGNIKDVIISNNDIIETNEKKEIVISKENKKPKKEVKPDYVIDDLVSPILSNPKAFISPLRGSGFRISSKFGYRTHPVYKTKKFHGGIDLAAPKNTPVYSVKAGVVIHSGFVRGYGNYVIVKHEDGYKSAYAHLNSIKVKKGNLVNEGVVIGSVGKTGTATGYHLHFELIKSNKKIDPKFLI
jgi:murein DD-endopeptidase MepM/ murein hydrolase activator NlpD